MKTPEHKVGDPIYLIRKTCYSGMTGNVVSSEKYVKHKVVSINGDELTMSADPKRRISIKKRESQWAGFWDPNYVIITKNEYVKGVLHEKFKTFCALSLFVSVPWFLGAVITSGTLPMWFYAGAAISAVWTLVSLIILGVK